ncbi:MAG: YggS family pyridoxal phosphate-dependent enzyme [Parahaliea sp.]
MEQQQLADNITKVQTRIRHSCEKYGRKPGDVTLLAVSKTHTAKTLRLGAELGLTQFGENYLSEALEKIDALADIRPLCWHFIGPVQSNKTRAIATHFDWVHSVDRLKIALRLNDQRPPELAPLQICLQVNISGEASKSGVEPARLAQLAAAVSELPRLQLRGLMAIPEAGTNWQQQRTAFAHLRKALQTLPIPALDTLSMGMSGDLEAAIAEGATIVRIGTDIFGARR